MEINSEVREIIRADYLKNHQGREYGVYTLLRIFDNLSHVDYSARKYGKVVVAYKRLTENAVEFHCTNGGNAKDLIEAVNQFNKEMSEQYLCSVTFYDNKKINELLKHSFCPSEFTKINGGIDKTYEAKFILREI